MPNSTVDIVGSRPNAGLSRIATYETVPMRYFEVGNGASEKTGSHKVEKAGREDEKQLDLGCCGASAVMIMARQKESPLVQALNIAAGGRLELTCTEYIQWRSQRAAPQLPVVVPTTPARRN